MFDYGLEQTGGFQTIAFCEIDQDCQKVLQKHWPQILCFSDICKFNFNEVKTLSRKLLTTSRYSTAGDHIPITRRVDVVTASWPCQGHSVAGKKKGLSDERSGLWKETKRLLKEIKPKYFIGENSANLRTTGLVTILQDLREVGFNHIEWHVLSACAFGAIHRRERIYIVAHRDSLRPSIETIASQEEKQKWRTKTGIIERDRSKTSPELMRTVNELSGELDEVKRRTRVKQCGNSLYWPIVEFIGDCILEYEKGNT